MTKHEKAYVRAGEKYLSIYRSSWTPREKISYDRIEDFYEVSTLLVLQLKNGKETQFDLELFSNSDVERIKRLIDRKI